MDLKNKKNYCLCHYGKPYHFKKNLEIRKRKLNQIKKTRNFFITSEIILLKNYFFLIYFYFFKKKAAKMSDIAYIQAKIIYKKYKKQCRINEKNAKK